MVRCTEDDGEPAYFSRLVFFAAVPVPNGNHNGCANGEKAYDKRNYSHSSSYSTAGRSSDTREALTHSYVESARERQNNRSRTPASTEAQGYITLYNGLLASQTIPAGTLLTGADGIQVMTDQTAFLSAGNPPIYGQATVFAHSVLPGSRGNIAGYDVNTAISSSILAKNTAPFYGGLDARTYSMVNQSDIDSAVTHLKPTLTQSIQGAFTTQLTPSEALITPTCVLKTVPDHQVGEEATQVQVIVSETCQAAYQQAALQQIVSHLMSQEAQQQYGTGYELLGDMQISLANTALTSTNSQALATIQVNAASQWVYQVGIAQISKQIAGKNKQQALSMLSHLDGIREVSVNLVGGYNDILPQDSSRIQVLVIYQFA